MLRKLIRLIHKLQKQINKKSSSLWAWLNSFIDARPVISFVIILAALVMLISLSNFIRKPEIATQSASKEPKKVAVYRIGAAPRITVQAAIEKSGVVQVTALVPGVVQTLYKHEGDRVERGTTVAWLSSNYQGGNTFSLSRKIAEKQLENIKDTLPIQKDMLDTQRELAKSVDDNSDELRDITSKSVSETENLIKLNDEILATFDFNLSQYTATNSAGVNDTVILTTKQLKSQFTSANNQLRQALAGARYQSDGNKPPADISNLQKEITKKQLDLQEKALDLSFEITKLNVQIAKVNEGMMAPSAPFAGTIQRVLVREGQVINPGAPLFVIAQDAADDPITAIAYVPRSIAQQVSLLEPSVLHIGDSLVSEVPSFITQEAIQGTLYGVYFPIPDHLNASVTDKGFISVDLPVGYFQTSSIIPFVPLDAVYQGQSESWVFVSQNGVVQSKKITLGQVLGGYVQVIDGLATTDAVILDRSVIVGELIEVMQ